MSASVNWFHDLSNLLNSNLPKDNEVIFSSSIQRIICYIDLKHCGRCESKKIFDKEKQAKLIHDLFLAFQQGITPSELVRSKLMRELIKRNRDNEENINFIGEKIVPQIGNRIFGDSRLKRDHAICYWLREFCATISDPETIAVQKRCIGDLPKLYFHFLMNGRDTIGKELVAEVNKGEIGLRQIDEIIEYIRGTKKLSSPVDLTDRSQYFGAQYRALVTGGDKYEEQFRESLVSGLENYKRDPTVTKVAFPKRHGSNKGGGVL